MDNKQKQIHPYDHTADLVDHYWGAIRYISGMIKASEIKAGLILSFYGIILNLIYISIGDQLSLLLDDMFMSILIFAALIFMSLSVYYSIRCFMPRLEEKFEKNIFFFGDVIKSFGNIKEFSALFYEISNDADRLFDQLGQQVFVNSLIAKVKFQYINKSLLFLALSFVVVFVSLVYALIF